MSAGYGAMFDMFRVAIEYLSVPLSKAAKYVRAFAEVLRAMFGIEKSRPRSIKRSSEGKAVSDVQTSGVEELLRRTLEAAFAMGTSGPAEDPMIGALKATRDTMNALTNAVLDLTTALGVAKNVVPTATSAAAKAVTGNYAGAAVDAWKVFEIIS
jgi:hypothetical protein